MSKSNLAVKEELENVAAEDVIIINQNEQENYRPSKDKEIRVNNNLSYLIMKKIVDIIAGILGTILLVPLIAVVWFIRICLHENDGPLFFEQIRIGKNGKQFRMYKFRTMVMEADEKLYRYLEENPEAKKEYKKYFDKHILTKSILLSGLVTCEEQINKYAYMEKKWKNRYESNDPVYYESYKACRLEWMGMREKIQAVLQKNQYFMSQIVQMVKGEEYRLPQKDVRAIVALIDSGEYEYREGENVQ